MKRAAWTSCSSASLISIFLFVNFFCLIEPSFVSGVPQSNEGLCSLIVRPMGYPCTEYIVQTEDGYLLTLQRISNGRSALRGYNGPPVFLQHGLFQGGDTWFLNSVDESLGFILADHGFDVWVGNVRGTRWSSKHITLSEHERAFWDWSWQDLAQYDLAAMLSYVQTETNSKVLYIGHSQGTIMALAAFTMPDMVKMVEASALLCPISYLDHISSNFVLRAVSMHLDQMLLSLGIHQLNFRSKIGVEIMDSLCDGHVDCGNLLGAITVIRKGTFAKYDFGWWENLKHYHSLHPPAFNLGDIPESLPLWIGYGGNDALADLTDLKRTIKELKSKPEQLYIESYGHIDFVFSVKAKDDVYADLIRFLRSRGRSTSY
ncbi:triacylglycerol lipase 1 isoform X2 [Dendrobium catenatum]|uniref:triacylglycerol lipase 1 isoform X2 n=1 Tax=Dendrobium catenatum TaxID=906689 RepID=UPI0009F71025|nr:triacylglycerol lipase 1 isoform X2 [Dendrobium catenatum]